MMKRPIAGIAIQTLFHITGIACITVISLVGTTGFSHIGLIYDSMFTGLASDPTKILLQVGLAACVWAFMVIGYHYVQLGRKKREVAVLRRATGTAMTEFLIVLVPYLLLTSGLAQLSQINVTGMLADVAIYDAARTVWLWEPEIRTDRRGAVSDPYSGASSQSFGGGYGSDADHLAYKAQVVAASILAPTAPADFSIFQAPNQSKWEMFDHRAVMVGAFRNTGGTSHWMKSSGAPALTGDGVFGNDYGTLNGSGETNTFVGALDTVPMYARAGRKVTIAEWGMWEAGGSMEAILGGNRVGARMVYRNHIAFPWFGYIWGEAATIAGRPGYFGFVRRELTFPKQPDMN